MISTHADRSTGSILLISLCCGRDRATECRTARGLQRRLATRELADEVDVCLLDHRCVEYHAGSVTASSQRTLICRRQTGSSSRYGRSPYTMAIGDRHGGPGGPQRDLEPAAPSLLDRRELSARRADRVVSSPQVDPVRDAGSAGAGGPLLWDLLCDLHAQAISETFSDARRSGCDDVPFGNWIIDTAECYTASSPPRVAPNSKRCAASDSAEHGLLVKHCEYVTYTPPPIRSAFATPLPGEGVSASDDGAPLVDGGPPVLVTTYRPRTEYPTIVAYVLWIDHTLHPPCRPPRPASSHPARSTGGRSWFLSISATVAACHLQRRFHARRHQ